jgi:hypothetical protein
MSETVLVIACGALARELVELQRRNRWEHLRIQCLPAELHNTPARIPGAVADALARYRGDHAHVFVAYADCGTGGRLDALLEKSGVERLPGAHCYEFYAGSDRFAGLCEEEPGTFYLTDFLVRHFDRLVVRGLGLDRHPELKPQYFGNYRRLVYLAQTRSDELTNRAREHAAYLGLEFAVQHTGLGPVERILEERAITWRN